jgi:hypothetical protein
MSCLILRKFCKFLNCHFFQTKSVRQEFSVVDLLLIGSKNWIL